MSDEMKRADEFEKATPRPWRACGANGGACSCGVIWSLPADAPIVEVYGEHEEGAERPAAEQRANSALVVRAVNAYEPMREALDAVQKCFVRHEDGCGCARCEALDKVATGLRAADETKEGR